jgi:hypothetical protein
VHDAFPRTVKELKQLRFRRRFSLAANGGSKASEAEIQSHYSREGSFVVYDPESVELNGYPSSLSSISS